MINILNKAQCTGCAACVNICPVNAMRMMEDECGFQYPYISDSCIGCNACEKVCQNRIDEKNNNFMIPVTYAAWSKDDRIRFESTSGGAFSELAKVVLNHAGMVAGAHYTENNLVEHILISREEELDKIRQSKYVQSYIGSIFTEIRENLLQGRRVLFCGAPCQVAGLKAFLNKEYENLITVDFICRGVNSPKAFQAWLSELESRKKSKVVKVWFKYKQNGWKKSPRCTRIDFQNGATIVQNQRKNLFMEGYLNHNLYMRPSCGECQFKEMPRQGDITLADFWGLESAMDDDKGASMILVNSDKGAGLLDEASPYLELYKRDFKEVFQGNTYFNKSVKIPEASEDFLRELDKVKFSKLLKKYTKTSISKRIRRIFD